MQKKLRLFVTGLVTVASLSLIGAMAMQPQSRPLAGGWGTLSVKDERVTDAARFAIAKQSAVSKTQLKLLSVLEASSQIVAGTNYAMTLKVLHDGANQKIHAIVWAKLDGSYELIQWSWH